MKKWGFLFIFIICIGVIAVKEVPFFQSGKNIQITYDLDNQLAENAALESIQKVEISKEQIYKGNLLLVNNEYPVQSEGIRSDVVNLSANSELVKGYSLFDNNTYLSEYIARKFSDMVVDANKDESFNFFITSGFRNFDEQNKLYREMGSSLAMPAGYSEHNLGLSLDVGTTQMKMEKAPEGRWIEKNAWKYGFVLRYPKDKTEITGIQHEPWHIRYVGLPHSAIMKEQGFVLEEYLDYLKEKKKISAKIDGKKYTVAYYPFSKNMTINLPKNYEYDISGDNMDGIIVTKYEL